MLGGVRHRPFPLLEREEMSRAGRGPPRRGAADVRAGRRRAARVRAAKYGREGAAAGQPGSVEAVLGVLGAVAARQFQIQVKLYRGGAVCGHLGALHIGEAAWFAKTRSKPMAQGVKRVGLIAFGVGISDCVHTAAALLEGGAERVELLHACRSAGEVALAADVAALVAQHPERFAVAYFLSREPEASAAAAQLESGGAKVVRVRVDRAALERLFGAWAAPGMSAECAFLAAGTRQMNAQTFGLLAEMGLERKLVGRGVPRGRPPGLGFGLMGEAQFLYF